MKFLENLVKMICTAEEIFFKNEATKRIEINPQRGLAIPDCQKIVYKKRLK